MWCAKLLTMTAITFTWANADFDRRHSTSEMGQSLPNFAIRNIGGCSELSTYRIEAFAGDGVVQRKANFDYARGGSRLAYTSRIASPRRRLCVARRGAIFLHI